MHRPNKSQRPGGSCSRRGEDPSPLHDCVKYPGRASSVGSVAAEQQARKAKRPCSSGGRRTPKRLCRPLRHTYCSWMLAGMGAEKTCHVPPHACSKRRQGRGAGLQGMGSWTRTDGGRRSGASRENKSAAHPQPCHCRRLS
jgi:hypothetical protein